MKYYSHHIGDFDRATRHLTRIERSIYTDLIHLYYITEKPLTLDIAMLSRKVVAHSEEETTAVINILAEFFIETADGWFHMRCDEELEAYRNSTSQKSVAGKASAAKKALKKQQALNGKSTSVERALNERATADQRHFNGTSTNHEPVTSNHEPLTTNQEPEVQKHQKQPPAPAVAATTKKTAEKKEEPNPLNLETWQSYKQAYTERYTVPPVRDAATNAKIKTIVRALGSEGPEVAAFFVRHSGSRYVAGMHQIGLLAIDYAKLRTEWATNTRMTQTKALQADKTATNLDSFAPLIAAAKAKEEAERKQHA